MTPTNKIFDEIDLPANAEYAANQEEYITLPAFRDNDGAVVTRWKLTWGERLLVLFFGDVWLTLLTFNQPLHPIKIEVTEPKMILINKK